MSQLICSVQKLDPRDLLKVWSENILKSLENYMELIHILIGCKFPSKIKLVELYGFQNLKLEDIFLPISHNE